jgi:hypothetical protein
MSGIGAEKNRLAYLRTPYTLPRSFTDRLRSAHGLPHAETPEAAQTDSFGRIIPSRHEIQAALERRRKFRTWEDKPKRNTRNVFFD